MPVPAPRVRYKNDCIPFCVNERTAREVPMSSSYTACIVTGNADQASEISSAELIREKDANNQVHTGHSATLDFRWCESPCKLKILDENNLPRVHICIVDEFTRHQVVRPAPEHTPPPRKKQCTRNLNATHVHQDWLNPKLVGLYRFRHFGNNLRKHYTKTSTCTYKDDTYTRFVFEYGEEWDWAGAYHRKVFAGQRGMCTILWTHTFDLNDACGLCLIWKCESLGIVIELLRFNREKLITEHHSWIRKCRSPNTLKELAASQVSQSHFHAEFTPPLHRNQDSVHQVNFAVRDLLRLFRLYLPALSRDEQGWFMKELFRVLGDRNMYTLRLNRDIDYLNTIVGQVATVRRKAQEVRRGGRLRDGTLPTTHHLDAMKAYDAFMRGDSDRASALANACDFMDLPAPTLLKGRIEHEMRPADLKPRIWNPSFQNEYQSGISCIVDAEGLIRVHSEKNPGFHTTIDLPALFESQDDETKERLLASLTRDS